VRDLGGASAPVVKGQPHPGGKRGPLGPRSRAPSYTMDRSMRIRINDFLSRSDSPVIT
jgi:hypothetical protein